VTFEGERVADLLNPSVIPWFVLLFVPGFISIKVYGLLVPTAERNWGSSAVEAVSYGCINLAVFSWAAMIVARPGFFDSHPVACSFILIGILLVAPAIWPVVLLRLLRSRLIKNRVLDPIPTAWDSFFERRQPCWVLVHLKDGGKIAGLLGGNSYASSYPEKRDLYLEEVWQIGESGHLEQRVGGTLGLWIDCDAFRMLEFLAPEGPKELD
jgi:hypothetical protein